MSDNNPLSEAINAHLKQILAGYRCAVPDVDASPIQLFGRLGALARLYELFSGQFFSEGGITHTDYQLMGLIRSGIASSAQELAFYLRKSDQEVSSSLDRLESAELVARSAEAPGTVSLTDRGNSTADELLRRISESQKRILDGLDESELRKLTRSLDELISRLAFLYS